MGEGSKRIYVGNLYPGVTTDELKEKFNRFGSVESAEVKHKTDIDGNPVQTFAFVNINVSDTELGKCINTLSNTKWKGYEMRVQQAKESFMSRLQKERSTREQTDRSVGRDKTNTSAYNPLAIFKDKLAAEGGNTPAETGEKKIVARHLGGDKNDPSRKIKKSGNFQKIGKSDLKNGQDQSTPENHAQRTERTEEEENESSEYNPLAMFRKQQTGEERPRKRKVDEGTVSDGIISFSADKSNKKSMIGKKRKMRQYHSSDEDEEEPVQPSPSSRKHDQPSSKLKAEDKENKRKKKTEKESKKSKEETNSTKNDESLIDEDKSKQDEEEMEVELDIEEEKKRNYEILSQIMGKEVKQVKKKTPKQPQNFMPRFDPTINKADDVEFSASSFSADDKSSKKFDVTSNLKAAFGSSGDKSNDSQPFSFGFLSSASTNDDETGNESRGKTGQLFTLDDEEKMRGKNKEDDFTNKFGNQLIGKSAGPVESFFFGNNSDETEEDTRLNDGVKFFFEDRPDLQAVRDGYQKKRADLKDIFRKRARSKAQLLRKNVKSKQNNMTLAKKKRRRQKKKQ